MQWLSRVTNDVVSDLLGRNDLFAQKQLQVDGILTETQLTQFFTVATTIMESAEIKRQLRLAAADGRDACDVVTEVQVRHTTSDFESTVADRPRRRLPDKFLVALERSARIARGRRRFWSGLPCPSARTLRQQFKDHG